MEERKWEDLEMDCLVNVLGRVGMESLLLDVPFVCKSWHKASLNPLCWKTLVFPEFAVQLILGDSFKNRIMDVYGINKLSDTAFIKFTIDRSCRNATVLVLPNKCTEEAFQYAVDECPALKILNLPRKSFIKRSSIIELIGKWKNLECLSIECSINLSKILPQIGLNCKNFSQLTIVRVSIKKEDASAIVTFLPKIKYLCLRRAYMNRENMVTILYGCKELVHLDVTDSIGYHVDDKILEHASHIITFKYEHVTMFASVYVQDYDFDYDDNFMYDYYYDDFMYDYYYYDFMYDYYYDDFMYDYYYDDYDDGGRY